MDSINSIFADFDTSLAALSTSREGIENLTRFAINYKAYAEYIAKSILARAKKTAGKELAPFYLIDSITKREIPEYTMLFVEYLGDVFSLAFENGNVDIKRALLKIYKAWDTFYPQEFLRSISARVRLPEIEKHILTPRDYEEIEAYNRTRMPLLSARNPQPIRRPPQSRPWVPSEESNNRMVDNRPRIPTIPAATPPPPPPMYAQRHPVHHPVITQHVPAPVITASDGPFAIIAKKFRAVADRAACAPIAFGNPLSLVQKNKVVTQSLYEEAVFQCRLCGMKNDRLQLLKDHLDRHFLANFLAMNDDKSVKNYAQTRASFQPKDMWIKGMEQEELGEVKHVHLIPYKEELKECYACKYEFDITYSQKYNDWVFTNAYEVVLEDESEAGKPKEFVLMHRACLNGSIIAQSESEKTKAEVMDVN